MPGRTIPAIRRLDQILSETKALNLRPAGRRFVRLPRDPNTQSPARSAAGASKAHVRCRRNPTWRRSRPGAKRPARNAHHSLSPVISAESWGVSTAQSRVAGLSAADRARACSFRRRRFDRNASERRSLRFRTASGPSGRSLECRLSMSPLTHLPGPAASRRLRMGRIPVIAAATTDFWAAGAGLAKTAVRYQISIRKAGTGRHRVGALSANGLIRRHMRDREYERQRPGFGLPRRWYP
jgi:hypothetical protein